MIFYVSSGSIFKTKNKVSDDKLNAQINSGAIITADLITSEMTIQANSGSVLTLDINAKMLDFSGNSGMIINAKGNAETFHSN
jgi:large exoprotein involved in heme utilization and adhesion